MEFHTLASNRYSCRALSQKPVEPALINQILETAILAPTAVNKQPYRIFHMVSPEAKNAIGQVTNFTFGAQNFLVVGYKNSDGWVRSFDGTPFACVDASIVATHIMMEIADLGLATTWVGHFDAPLLRKLCPEMAEYELIAIFPIGYAAEDAQPSPRHTERSRDVISCL